MTQYHDYYDMYFQPDTNAQLIGPIVPGRKQPVLCRPCTKVIVDEWLALPKDERGAEPRIIASMDIRAHNKWVHPRA